MLFSAESIVYVGTYTGPQSKGIYAWRFDDKNGSLKEIGLVGETENPSFLAISPDKRFLYAVNEVREGAITAFSIDRASGKLTKLNSAPSRGASPCHISVDKTGRTALVANYSSGTVAAVRIGADGKLGESSAFDQHKGTGPNEQRQKGPHAHSINLSANQKYALAADLGNDDVFIYRFNPNDGTLTAAQPPSAKTAPGAGPRHSAIHPSQKFVFVINELDSTITTFAFDADNGMLKSTGTVSTLPADWKGTSYPAEIVVHPNGNFVYGSNRGHDSIAVFAVDKGSGKLTLVQHVLTGGKQPRNFTIDPSGRYLFAANQGSSNIKVFALDPKSGKLSETGKEISAPTPVCIRFLAAR